MADRRRGASSSYYYYYYYSEKRGLSGRLWDLAPSDDQGDNAPPPALLPTNTASGLAREKGEARREGKTLNFYVGCINVVLKK